MSVLISDQINIDFLLQWKIYIEKNEMCEESNQKDS